MLPPGVQVFLAREPIDLRCGFNKLSGMVRDLSFDPRCSAAFVFYGKRRHAVKILYFDGTGMCLFYKRLDAGTLAIPEIAPDSKCVELDEIDLNTLLHDIVPPRRRRRRVLH